jgi:hypothetical protein
MKDRLVSPTEEIILLAVQRYHYITRDQLARLLVKNDKYLHVSLKQLIDEKYLAVATRPSVSFPYLYLLGVKGVRFLRNVHEMEISFYPSVHTSLSYYTQVPHILQVNEFLIAVEKLVKESSNMGIGDLKHDISMRKEILKARPDAWVDLRIGNEEIRLWVEIDRGTLQEPDRFKRKIQAIVECIRDGWQRGRPTHILFIATDRARLKTIFKWTQEVLLSLNLKGKAFRFTFVEEGPINFHTMFFDAIWYQPFEEGRKPLLYR